MPQRERFGDFLLHERLAVGGMGELYLATRAEKRGPPFALKIMVRSYREHPEFASMFHDEARIGMRLSHSNIVVVHEIGYAEETPFIVMEYVHGENLRSVLRAMHKREERMAPSLAVKLAIDTLRGLDHAHRATDESGAPLHLVHRDLSPDNVLVSYEGNVKLLDFGIAKAQGRTTTTQSGVVKGKPLYMSPEQAAAKPVDARSDLFSASVVLMELLTGERRFSDDDIRWESARNWKPKTLVTKVPGIPADLDAALMRALDPEPARRFQTAGDLATELTRIARSGLLPRAKESLPALLKRLFPEGSARKFDSSDVTLFELPGFLKQQQAAAGAASVNLALRTPDAPPDGSTRIDGDPTRAPIGSFTVATIASPLESPTIDGVRRLDARLPDRGDDDRPTTPSFEPRIERRRRLMLALVSTLLPIGFAGAFSAWRFWPRTPPPAPKRVKPVAKPKKKPAKRATPRPTPKKSPTPKRR